MELLICVPGEMNIKKIRNLNSNMELLILYGKITKKEAERVFKFQYGATNIKGFNVYSNLPI